MNTQYISDHQIADVIKADMGMALGCTEPIAAALAVVKAREVLGSVPESIHLNVSGNIYKNGLGVGIPGTSMRGIRVAAALGALTGRSEDALELLKDVNDSISAQATAMVKADMVSISIVENVDKLHIEAILVSGADEARAVVEKKHTFISYAERNGKACYKANDADCSYTINESGKVDGLSIERLYDFATQAPVSELEFLMEGVSPNWSIAMEGLEKEYGMKVGQTIKSQIIGEGSQDPMRSSMSKVAAGVDARMAGSIMPVMTNSGSGNQGITIYVPIIDAAREQGASDEELMRALALGNSIPIHIKKQIGPLSALCGIVPASTGAACGVALIKGASLEQIKKIIQFMLANTSGVFCDGAKPSCALKASTGISAAYQAISLSMDTASDPFSDGILDQNVEGTIDNLAHIASVGMNQTDEEILGIMRN